MALSADRIVYGIHSIAPYRRSNGLPYGILKVLGGGSISLSAEFEDLFGGSNKYQWASEVKTISSEFTATVKSMPDFLFELFLGATASTTAASATGTVGTIANKLGTTVSDATTGIASVTATAADEGDLKAGLYVVKAATSTTVDVYLLTDIDFSEGTDVSYVDDALKITASPVTVTDAGGTTALPDFGLTITGGSGTVAMTADDTAIFYVAKAHGGISEISVGSSSSVFPAFGALCLAAKRADSSLFEIEFYNALGGGLPIPLEETVFAIPDLTVKLLYDADQDAVFRVRAMAGV